MVLGDGVDSLLSFCPNSKQSAAHHQSKVLACHVARYPAPRREFANSQLLMLQQAQKKEPLGVSYHL